MAYVLSKDLPENWDLQEYKDRWTRYYAYLAAVRTSMPTSAYEFATADWHYRSGHAQWPYDGSIKWVKTRTAPLGSWNEDLWARILKLGQELDDKRPAADEGTEYDQWIRAVEAANIEPVEAIPRDKGINDLEIWLRVQTAHDPEGYLDLRYKGVVYYSFNAAFGDWLLDEVRLSQAGRLVHEIELISATYWTIECEDIEVEWQPL